MNDDLRNSNGDLPILIVESQDRTLFKLSVAVRQAGINNKLFIFSDMATATRYLEGRGIYSDREKYPAPGLALLDVTMPRLDHAALPPWLTPPPPCRHVVVADIGEVGRNILPAESRVAFGPNAVLCKLFTTDSLISMIEELRRTWVEGEKLALAQVAQIAGWI